MLFWQNRGMPRKVINFLKEQENIKIVAYEVRNYKPKETTFHKVIDRF
jgi:hypothetical protein